MPDSIVFISHNKVKEGKLDDLRRMTEMMYPRIEAEKPGTVLHRAYLDADSGQVHFIHVFPDADAMDAHMEGADERVTTADEFIETTAMEIYGRPSDTVLEFLGRNPSIQLTVRPGSLGGYIRLGN